MFQRCDIRFPVWKEDSYMEWCFGSFKINACTSAVSGNWARMALLSWRSSKSSGLSSIVSSSCQSEGRGGGGALDTPVPPSRCMRDLLVKTRH